MFETNKNAGNLSRWVILGILGIFLVFYRHFALNIIYIVFAIGLMLAAAAGVYGWWQARKAGKDDVIGLVSSAVMFVVGLWILRNPNSFDRIINMIIGVVLIVSGANWLNTNSHETGNKLMSVLSIVAIIVGVIIATSHAATNWVATVCGFGLIYTAITGFIAEKAFRE